jgi:hypothetical protein
VLALYLAAAAATLGLSGHHLLPLFEGVGPPPPYQWVNPPSAFATGNTKPKPASADIAIRAGTSAQASAFTPDGQFVVNFNAGSFAPHGSDTGVHAAVTPLDPATLGPLPPGLAADGNAYRIQLTYTPSGAVIDSVATPGSVALVDPNPGQVLLYSADGQSWSRLATQIIPATSAVISTFTAPGWFVTGASPTGAVAGPSNHLGTAAIALLVAGLAIVLALTPVAIRAVRRRRPPGSSSLPEPAAPPDGPPNRTRRR